MGESGSSAFGLLMALGAALATAINFLGARARAPLDVTPVLVPACFLLSLGSGLLGGARHCHHGKIYAGLCYLEEFVCRWLTLEFNLAHATSAHQKQV